MGAIGIFLLGAPVALVACDPGTTPPPEPTWAREDGTVNQAAYDQTKFPVLDSKGNIIRDRSGDPVLVTTQELFTATPLAPTDRVPTYGPNGEETQESDKLLVEDNPIVKERANQP